MTGDMLGETELQRLWRASQEGRRTPVEEWTDDEWVRVLSTFGPKTHTHICQRWVWEQRMAARE